MTKKAGDEMKKSGKGEVKKTAKNTTAGAKDLKAKKKGAK
jgi:hypothetical protein